MKKMLEEELGTTFNNIDSEDGGSSNGVCW